MRCTEFLGVLEAWLDGTLVSSQRAQCERHLDDCSRCYSLVEPFVAEAADTCSPALEEDFVQGVVARTSGSSCPQAQALLAESWQGPEGSFELQSQDELLRSHLESCASCQSLHDSFAWLCVELPGMAAAKPHTGFVEDVLRASLPWSSLLRRELRGRWRQWVHRPRFALEAAYLGAWVMLLMVNIPGSPLASLPEAAFELARRPVRADVSATVDQLEEEIEQQLRQLAASDGAEALRLSTESVELAARGGAKGVLRAASQAQQQLATLQQSFASLLERAGETDDSAPQQTPEDSTPGSSNGTRDSTKETP